MSGRSLKSLTVLALVLGFLVQASCAQPAKQRAPDEFATFWTGFRTAVLAGERDRIASMTEFPFRTRGPLDSDPVRTHDRAGFPRLLDRLLAQDPGTARETSTMRRLIQDKTAITERDVNSMGNQARVGNFVFRKVGEHWVFTLAYLDE